MCRGNEAEKDRALQCKPLLEVEEEEEQEGSFTSSATEEHRRGRQDGRERQREEEEGVVRLHVSNELCSHAH